MIRQIFYLAILFNQQHNGTGKCPTTAGWCVHSIYLSKKDACYQRAMWIEVDPSKTAYKDIDDAIVMDKNLKEITCPLTYSHYGGTPMIIDEKFKAERGKAK